MDCPECATDALTVPVSPDLRSYLPGNRPAVAVCPRCLSVVPADDAADDLDFAAVSDAFPTDREAATALVVLLALLDSPALYRDELGALIGVIERAGVDPLLALDRLAGDSGLDPHLDLERRRRQLEQFLS